MVVVENFVVTVGHAIASFVEFVVGEMESYWVVVEMVIVVRLDFGVSLDCCWIVVAFVLEN